MLKIPKYRHYCLSERQLEFEDDRDFYSSFIYLYLSYCSRVWGFACVTYLSKLHIIQKRIARLILGKQKYSTSHRSFKELNILSIYDKKKNQMFLGYVLLKI